MRRPLVLCLVVGLLAGCTGAAPTAPPDPDAPAPAAGATTAPAATTPPSASADPLPSLALPELPAAPDEARRQAALEAGLDPLAAELVAGSATTAVLEGSTVRALTVTPLGLVVETTIEFGPPDGTPGLVIERSGERDDGWEVIRSFEVPASLVPPDVLAGIAGTGTRPTAVLAAWRPEPTAGAPVAFSFDTVKATVTDWVTDKVGGLVGDKLDTRVVKYLTDYDLRNKTDYLGRYKDALAIKGELANAAAVIKAAMDAAKVVGPALDRIAELRRCAENPTNPLTVKAYRERPEEKQRILDRLDEIRDEIREHGEVLFFTLLLGTASGLIKSVPWLGAVMGKGVDFTVDSMNTLIARLVAEAKKMVTPCHGWRFEYASTGATWSGVHCGSIAEPWIVEFTAFKTVGTLVLEVDEKKMKGTWEITLGTAGSPADTRGWGKLYKVEVASEGSVLMYASDGQMEIKVDGQVIRQPYPAFDRPLLWKADLTACGKRG